MDEWNNIGDFRYFFGDDVLTYQRCLVVELICGCYRAFKHYNINPELNRNWGEIMQSDIEKMIEQLKNPQKDLGFEIKFMGCRFI